MPGLTYLRMLCEQFPGVEVVRAFNDPLKMIEERDNLQFDLCIMDIEMPGMNGLQLAQLLDGKPVIFTTAYKEHAAEAFDLEAVDYIRKPIRKERLEKAIQKAMSRLEHDRRDRQFARLNTDKGKTILFFDQVMLVTSSAPDRRDKKVLLENGDEIIVKSISFDQLISLLPTSQFCRINKRQVIAIKAVKYYTHEEITTTLPDEQGIAGRKLTLSDNYRVAFTALTTR